MNLMSLQTRTWLSPLINKNYEAFDYGVKKIFKRISSQHISWRQPETWGLNGPGHAPYLVPV